MQPWFRLTFSGDVTKQLMPYTWVIGIIGTFVFVVFEMKLKDRAVDFTWKCNRNWFSNTVNCFLSLPACVTFSAKDRWENYYSSQCLEEQGWITDMIPESYNYNYEL